MTTHEQQAYELGQEHARNAASWIDTTRAVVLLGLLDNGDPAVEAYLPARPNLSGEWAGDLTPTTLYEQTTGLNYNTGTVEIIDALCAAYEAGVSDTFQPECERILRAALA
jgi:hypothetical protein